MNVTNKVVVLSSITLLGAIVSLPAHSQIINRNGRGTAKINRVKGNSAEKQSNQELEKARVLLHNAHLTLDKALPIYEGHRVRSREFAHIATEEITDGLKFEKKHHVDNDNDGNLAAKISRKTAQIPHEEKALKKYSQQEIQASNALVQQALALELQAHELLQAAKPDYGGERAEAIKLVEQAIQEAQTALKLRC